MLVFLLLFEELELVKWNGDMLYVHLLMFITKPQIRTNLYSIDSMSVMINSKREQFRREIIKKQKQELFMNRRKELLRSIESNFIQQQNNMNPVLALKQKVNLNSTFEYLKAKLNENDYGANILKYVEEGLISTLMNYLKEGIEVAEILEIICYIINKQQPFQFAETFYNYGILEYAFNYLQSNPKASNYCVKILYLFTTISDDYSEVLLINKKHQVLMQYFLKRICHSRNPQEQNDIEGQSKGFYISLLLILQKLITIRKSTLDFTEEQEQIYKFILMLVQKRLFLKTTLGMLYQCVAELSKNIIGPILILVNQILGEVKIEDKCLWNLFALIYIIVSKYHCVELNFQEFYKLGVLAGQKIQKPFILIMQFYVNNPNFINFVPKNQQWWEKILSSPLNSSIHCLMLRFIHKLEIKSEWIWRVYAAALAQDKKQVQNEVLTILNVCLKKRQSDRNILTFLHKHRITSILENLSHENSHSPSISENASQLLEYILGPMTQQSSQMI